MSRLEKILEHMYMEILDKHGNPKWAVEELEWKIFVEMADEFEKLQPHEQWIIRNYMGALQKLHGGR